MTSFEWEAPFPVIVVVATIVYLSGRRSREGGSPPAAWAPTNGADLIQRVQQTLGMAIVVESIESPPSDDMVGSEVAGPQVLPYTIRATLMDGRHTARVMATGLTKSDAWADLARIAIAWRNSDYKHIPMWWGGA